MAASDLRMDPPPKMPIPTQQLFECFLRLKPSLISESEPKVQKSWLTVEKPNDTEENTISSHVQLNPPADSGRRRATERFGFTKVLLEEASQLSVFEETGAVQLVKNVLSVSRDGLIATLGVTGSGKVSGVQMPEY